jgi:hypothetical protein
MERLLTEAIQRAQSSSSKVFNHKVKNKVNIPAWYTHKILVLCKKDKLLTKIRKKGKKLGIPQE